MLHPNFKHYKNRPRVRRAVREFQLYRRDYYDGSYNSGQILRQLKNQINDAVEEEIAPK